MTMGLYEDALVAFDKVLVKSPNDPGALNNKGIALKNLGRLKEAVIAYENAIRVDPDDPERGITKAMRYWNSD